MSNPATAVVPSIAVAASDVRYFDLHTSGVGYLNRARELILKKASFLAVDLSALRGETDNVEYTRFDCRVSGKEAQTVVRQLKPAIEAKQKVLVGFKIGDLYPTTFVYERGDRKGQTGISLKAHLLRIAWAKVDGELVYQAPRDPEASSTEETPAQAEAIAA